MLILIIFSFLAGIITILSPCILPVLPIVLSGSLAGGKRRPLGIVTGFVLSFTFFTLFLTSLVRAIGIPADTLRNVSIIIILIFGVSLLIPKFQLLLESLFAKLSNLTPQTKAREGFFGGILVGVSIGLVWTPCVGPILGSVISLALTGTVTGTAIFVTFSYSLGTAIPMLAIVYGGRTLLNKVPWLTRNTAKIQKAFGVVMILTAIAIYFNFDRAFQAYILEKFPSYGTGLTKIEESPYVEDELELIDGDIDKVDMGKPIFDVIPDMGTAPELIPGGAWFNISAGSEKDLPELAEKGKALKSLRGKVVLIDFWTYTCINCIRTLPYLKSWHEKYADDGLVIIGIHTPEFEFEKSEANVAKAISDFGLKYVVVQDNNYETWRAYNNRFWPAKYLINKDGKVVYTHFGEGAYDETEKVIQKLLTETGKSIEEEIKNPSYSVYSRTPELYLGYGRMQYFATPVQLAPDEEKNYQAPLVINRHYFGFNGNWTVGREYSMPKGGAELILEFEAREVFLVMRPVSEKEGKINIYLDGDLVDGDFTSFAGEDVSGGQVTVSSDRLYRLIRLDSPGVHNLRLEFLDSNVETYAFTFG